ncbi:MAG: TolC family protein, partial [Candidatus Sabulitectum sp.]|nr:TolC family protein [Candidatus Sabulitectum sp.]
GLLSASLRARVSELNSTAAERSYWPSLRASAGWSWNDDTLDDINRMFEYDGFNAGVNLSWNVFDGFLRESRINSARASSLASQASLETLENSVHASVESISNSLRIDIRYYSDSQLMLEQAQEQYRLSLMSYEMGALRLMDLLDAQADLAQSEANLVSARVAALTSEASLMIQLGRMPRLGE